VTLYDILLNMDNLKLCFVVVVVCNECKILIISLTKAGSSNALSRLYLLLAHWLIQSDVVMHTFWLHTHCNAPFSRIIYLLNWKCIISNFSDIASFSYSLECSSQWKLYDLLILQFKIVFPTILTIEVVNFNFTDKLWYITLYNTM
jgi:hypothetical protein